MSNFVYRSNLKKTDILVIKLSQDGFESDYPEMKFQTITSQSQFEKVTGLKFITNSWTVICNQMVKYQLPHTRFNQSSDHKHDICLYGKLSNKLFVQAVNKNENWTVVFLRIDFRSDCPRKF